MNKNTKRSPLLRSDTISNKKVNAIINQLNKIPNFWKKRFIQDEWQLVLTDKMPKEFGGILGKFHADGCEKQMWLNVGNIDIYSNIIYVAFAYYVMMEYSQITESPTFNSILERNERELTLFLRFRGNFSSKKESIFAELFSFIIETNGNASLRQIDEPYQYVKKWVFGQIFERNLSYIPNYIEVGVDVIDEQIEMTKNAFQDLPQGLQQKFINEKWKIRISNEKLIKNSTYGLCSSFDRKIFIRSSSPDLQKTIWHEFGHYLDLKEFLVSHRKPFKTIYNNEKMFLRSLYESNDEFEYGTSNSEEYFAEIFALYMNNQETLKNHVFKSFEFMQNVVLKWR